MKEPRIPKVYILPNLCTTFNLFCGFYAIIAVFQGDFMRGALAILIAGFFDSLDGRIARLTRTTSQFGAEYDSLCDLISFGLAPALLAHQWMLQPFGRYGWLAAFLYVATTALRLARFNVHIGTVSSRYFVGLPCPGAAYMISTTFLFCQFIQIDPGVQRILVLALVYILSYLMVSSIRYPSFKKPETLRAKTFQGLVVGVLLVTLVATEPQVTLFLLIAGYIFLVPLQSLFFVKRTLNENQPQKKTGTKVEL